MIIKYKTKSYSNDIIEMQITRETKAYYMFEHKHYTGKIEERREKIDHHYHNSREDAIRFLISRSKNKIENYYRMAKYEEAELKLLEQLQ